MLEIAVKSQIPIVAIQTLDPLNIELVLGEILGKPVQLLETATAVGKITGSKTFTVDALASKKVYWTSNGALPWANMYEPLAKKQSSLIVVNPEKVEPEMYDAGFVTCPISLIEKFVKKWYNGSQQVQLIASLSGLEYKQVVEIVKMATTVTGEFTPRAIQKIRRKYFGTVQGLIQVKTDMPFYYPQDELVNWVEVDGKFLLHEVDPILTPRGLLFNGPPGTGKTMGAKYLASTLELPLYLLDMATLLSKYVGDSEKNLRAGLKQAENSAPCVLLIDEIEKLFSTNDDSGVTARVLAMLLWWLQEHEAKVLTVMTTNAATKIPPELVRPGRIDRIVGFSGFTEVEDALNFVTQLAETVEHVVKLPYAALMAIASHTKPMTQAALAEAVYSNVKNLYAANWKGVSSVG